MRMLLAAAVAVAMAGEAKGQTDDPFERTLNLSESVHTARLATLCQFRDQQWASRAFNRLRETVGQIVRLPAVDFIDKTDGAARAYTMGIMVGAMRAAEGEFRRHGDVACRTLQRSNVLHFLDR